MNVLTQIAIVLGISLAGEAIAAVLPFSFPASVIGMVLLLALLCTGWLKNTHVESMSGFLLANMAVLFVPAGVNVLRYWDVLTANLLPIVLISLISTPLVYAATAWSVQLTIRLMQKKHPAAGAGEEENHG